MAQSFKHFNDLQNQYQLFPSSSRGGHLIEQKKQPTLKGVLLSKIISNLCPHPMKFDLGWLKL